MNHIKRNALAYLLLLSSIVAGYFFYAQLPEILVTQWTAYGSPSTQLPKQWVFIGTPLFGVLILLLLDIQLLFQPRENSRMHRTASLLAIVLLVGCQWFVIYKNIYGGAFSSIRLVHLVFSVVLIVIGNGISKLQQNYVGGFRTPWSLASEENWFHTHRFGARAMVLGGFAVLVGGFIIRDEVAVSVFMVAVFLASVLLPVGYSYYYHRAHQQGGR